MRSWFAQWKLKLALLLVGEDATVVPATTLAAVEVQVVTLTDYIALHSGRLNDGTTRPVRKKLRNALQVILSLVEGCYAIEQGVGMSHATREEIVPNGLQKSGAERLEMSGSTPGQRPSGAVVQRCP